MMSELLLSRYPSTIHAIEATMKMENPATVTRAFKLEATKAAATTVVTAATVLSIVNSSKASPQIQRAADIRVGSPHTLCLVLIKQLCG